MKKITLAIILSFIAKINSAQIKFYEDSFHGGVTCAGYSPGTNGQGTGTMTVHIAPGSTIHKAYLLSGRLGNGTLANVTLNSLALTFDATNQASTTFNTAIYGGASAVHAIDITSQISAAVNVYTLIISPQSSSGSSFFTDFYLYIAYENAALPVVNTALFLNTLDFAGTLNYNLNLTYPIDTTAMVAFAADFGYMCDPSSDGEKITINSTMIGQIGGHDINSDPSCGGTVGSFYYESNTLHGLSDDSADQAVDSTDALSNMSQLVNNNTTNFSIDFTHAPSGSVQDNSTWAWVLAYGGGCTTPAVAFQCTDTNFCEKKCIDFTDFTTNNPTSWHWYFQGATPDTSITQNPTGICYNADGVFDVTLVATNGCSTDSFTFQNFIHEFIPPPSPTITQHSDTLISSPASGYQWYLNLAPINGANSQSYIASGGGNYFVQITDSNGCTAASGIVTIEGVQEFLAYGLQFTVDQISLSEFIVAADHVSGKNISLKIFSAIGKTIYTVSEKNFSGKYLKQIDLSGQMAGIYFMQIGMDEKTFAVKLLLAK